jgi:GntR family transcriptional regulator
VPVAADAEQHCRDGRRRGEHTGRIDAATAPGAPPRFLDQRLELCNALREIAIVLGIGGTGRDGNRHRQQPPSEDATITSTMRNVKVDRNDPLELHEQVAGEIRRAISDGEAKPGERLPPAKDLAAVLGVNTNTVLRALRELRDEGLLEFRRGRGVTVTGTPERSAVVERVRDLVQFARTQGYRPDELVAIIQELG